MCDKSVEQLLKDLASAEATFARAYLEYRETATKTDTQGRPTAFLSVDDAKANVILLFQRQQLELPEVIRYRLHAALAIERSVEPS